MAFAAKNILRFLPILVLFCAFSACHPTKGEKPSQTTTTQVPILTTPPPPPPKTPQEAVERGIAFLEKRPWELDFVYMYTYLQPQFHWRNIAPQLQTQLIKDSLKVTETESAQRMRQELYLFERLLDPSFRLPADQFAKASDVDVITLPALYCDVQPVDTAQYFPVLREALAYGGYDATHTLLAYLWLRERNCLPKAVLDDLRIAMIDANEKILGDRPIWSDIQLEVAALLKAIGEVTPDHWATEIMANQRADGGWQYNDNTKSSDTHATILAIWYLAMEGR